MRLERHKTGIDVIISSKKNYFNIIFLTAWLGGWTVGGFFAWGKFFSGLSDSIDMSEAFIGFWLIGWLAGELMVSATLAWMLGGIEKISITSSQFTIRREIFGIGYAMCCQSQDITGISYTSESLVKNRRGISMPMFGADGNVSIRVKGKTFRFGAELDEFEAKELAEAFLASGYLPKATLV